MKGFILTGLGFIGFGVTFIWFIVLILKDIHSKRFSKENNMRYGKEASKTIYHLYIVGCIFISVVWLALFLIFLNAIFTPRAGMVDEIIAERTMQIVPSTKERQAEKYQEFLDKKNNMGLSY